MQSSVQPGSLGEQFQDFGAAPTDALWGQIEAALDDKKKKKRGIIWWWIGGASAAAAIFFGIVMNNSNQSGESNATLPVVDTADDQGQEEIQITEENHNAKGYSDELELKSEGAVDVQQTFDFKDFQVIQPNDEVIADNDAANFVGESEDRVDLDLMNKMTSPSSTLYAECEYPRLTLNEIEEDKIRMPWEFGVINSYWAKPSDLVFTSQKEMMFSDLNFGGQSQQSDFATVESVGGNTNPLASGNVSRLVNIQVFAGKYINSRAAWRVGLEYNRTAYRSSFSYTAGPNPEYNGKTVVTSLAVPISLRYDFAKRPKYQLTGGLTYHSEFPIAEKSSIYLNNTVMELAEVASYGSGTSGYFGAWQGDLSHDFRVGKKTFINLTTSYRYYFTQYIKSNQPLVKQRHWLGASVGLTWEL